MNLDQFIIHRDAALKEALEKIERNHHGIILVSDDDGSIIALATDGDIRRKFLDGGKLDDPVHLCFNKEFVWADEKTPREKILKQLDHKIRTIPILDENRRLVSVLSREYFPVLEEERVYARARSPVRVSFGAGGSDLTHYFNEFNGAVINTAVSIYSHSTLKIRDDEKIIIESYDLQEKIESADLDSFLKTDTNMKLIQAIIKLVQPTYGFELYIHSDFPSNSGLGGSSAVSAAIIGCFNQFRQDKWDQYEIAEIAFQAERLYMGVSGGWQDQYATVFGGFNFMEFQMEQNIVHPLRIPNDVLVELEESLVLCDTVTTHNSGNVHDDQKNQMKQDDIRQMVSANVELTYQMRNFLLRGKLFQFGELLDKAWMIKRQLSKKISNDFLDSIYFQAKENGAVGGKLLGAGGGGFFVFYVTPFKKHELLNWLKAQGLIHRPFRFEPNGLQAWTVRENRNQYGETANV